MRLGLIALLAAGVALAGVGCGTSAGPQGASTAPVGPAAPPAASAQRPTSDAPPADGGHTAVFLHVVGAGFEAVSLAPDIALRDTDGDLMALDAAPASPIAAGKFHLAARGQAPPGKYDAVVLKAGRTAGWIQPAPKAEGVPLRLPSEVILSHETEQVHAGQWRVLVVTLDLSGLRIADDAVIGAGRFSVGSLEPEEACALTGEVAPAASLARVYACWGGSDPIAVTQPDPFDGAYTLEGLPPGDYRLRVVAAGHETYLGPERALTLAGGETMRVPVVVLTPRSAAR